MNSLLAKLRSEMRSRRLGWELSTDGTAVSIPLGGRNRLVAVQRDSDRYAFTSVVLGTADVTRSARRWRELARLAWRRNASTDLVTFTFDARDRLVGRIEYPAVTLDAPELVLALERIAIECDRFAELLTGRP